MSKGRVLVVDGNEAIREIVAGGLGERGYEVHHVRDGSEALVAIRRDCPALVIAEVVLPVMDGWALCEEIRRDPSIDDVPFIFLTAEADVPKRIKGLSIGADDYVCIPFSVGELVARCEAVMRRRRQAPPAEAGEEKRLQSDLSGHTSHLSLPDLLQLPSLNGKTGTLHLWGQSVARIYFRHGEIINAETGGLRAEKALFRIMSWPEARFEFESGEPPQRVRREMRGTTSSMIMEGLAHLDELRDLLSRLPPRGQRLRVPRALSESLDRMDLNTTQRLMLYTAGSRGASLSEIVDSVPERDLDAYMAAIELMDRGLLEVLEVSVSF
jgi:DNA-binding response OmpR family regulator